MLVESWAFQFWVNVDDCSDVYFDSSRKCSQASRISSCWIDAHASVSINSPTHVEMMDSAFRHFVIEPLSGFLFEGA
jgi:hypothetical protein